ncbi:MAG: APC family permease [Promethearchaeota archaeon]
MSRKAKLFKRKKFSWIVVTSFVVGAIVGSGIVRHSTNWPGIGGNYAVFGIFLVWIAYMIIGLAMCDNVSMMPEKGGTYAWTRKTMGKGWGTQIGWIYLVGFTCLSVILCWLAYIAALNAILYFMPERGAFLAAVIFSVIIPMFFIIMFTIVITLGVKRTTQVVVGFFTIKVTMWLSIVGIALLHYNSNRAVNAPGIEPIGAILAVGSASLFAMQGIDAVSLISDDIHEPGKNYLKGVVVGMIIVLILYTSTVLAIMGLVGQVGAQEAHKAGGITVLFLEELNIPPPVLLVFIVISIVGTLFINMYLMVRLSGAMAENGDFYFMKHAQKHLIEQSHDTLDGLYHVEMPIISIILSTIVYGIFFVLIFVESIIDPETQFVLYVIDQLALYPFLVIMFFIALTNFKAHRMGIAKKRNKEKNEYRWARGWLIPIFGMVSVVFIIGLNIFLTITNPPTALPTPKQSYAWQFWYILGLIFPIFMVVPGILYWLVRRKKVVDVPVTQIVINTKEDMEKKNHKMNQKKQKGLKSQEKQKQREED